MDSLSQSTFLCPVCEQEKATTELHKAPHLRFTLCKSCAAVGKYCPECETYKLFSEFSRDSHRGVTYCKPCKRDRDSKDHDPVKNRAHRLKMRFNLTQAEYDAMFLIQRGLCAICQLPEIAMDNTGKKTRALAVDHDHETGAVRQLLCGNCNNLLGYARESYELLQAANEYLRRHKA